MLQTPAEFTEFAWCAALDGGYRLNLADGEWIDLREDNLGRWCAAVANPRNGGLPVPTPTAGRRGRSTERSPPILSTP